MYREATVTKGNLTVGVAKTGSVSVEETEQTFDVDISQYSADESSYSWNSSSQGMNNPFEAMSQIFSSSSTSSDIATRKLIVNQVLVSAGEEIKAGDAICSLEESSVQSIRNALKDDADNAKNTYQEKETQAKVSELSASQEIEQNKNYGEYAQIKYDIAISKLQDAVENARTAIEEAQQTLDENKEELAGKQETLITQKKVLENATFAKEGTDKTVSLYYWLQAENARDSAAETVKSLEDDIETLTDTIEQEERELITLNNDLTMAQKDLETGTVEAKADFDIEQLRYENAQEIYDTAVSSYTLQTEMAQSDYQDAQSRLDDFDSNIVDNNIVAASDGVISSVAVSVGDYIFSDSSIITYNSYEGVTITITVDEEEKNKIKKGTSANISLSAFPDTTFNGEVTEIGDAVYDSDSGTNEYDITVTLSGDIEKIYDGMSAEVTLVTKEEKEVLYIPNRAVTRENEKSYVKIKDTNGNIRKVSVSTGFSDGINVEILEGLSEGDTILVESKVNKS